MLSMPCANTSGMPAELGEVDVHMDRVVVTEAPQYSASVWRVSGGSTSGGSTSSHLQGVVKASSRGAA
jgi:hypothetical protein